MTAGRADVGTPQFVLPVDDATKVEYNSFAPAVNAFAAMLNSSFGITFPEVNAAPILYKMVRDLSLPRELIHARRSNNWRLVTYTPIAFVYLVTRRIMIDNATSLSLPLHKRRGRDYPDLTLAASMVITLKLVWGLDGIPRIPQDANDMSSALPRLQEWLDFSERLQELYPTTAVPAAART